MPFDDGHARETLLYSTDANQFTVCRVRVRVKVRVRVRVRDADHPRSTSAGDSIGPENALSSTGVPIAVLSF